MTIPMTPALTATQTAIAQIKAVLSMAPKPMDASASEALGTALTAAQAPGEPGGLAAGTGAGRARRPRGRRLGGPDGIGHGHRAYLVGGVAPVRQRRALEGRCPERHDPFAGGYGLDHHFPERRSMRPGPRAAALGTSGYADRRSSRRHPLLDGHPDLQLTIITAASPAVLAMGRPRPPSHGGRADGAGADRLLAAAGTGSSACAVPGGLHVRYGAAPSDPHHHGQPLDDLNATFTGTRTDLGSLRGWIRPDRTQFYGWVGRKSAQ